MNFDYIYYPTPNKTAREMIEDEEIRNSTIVFPTAEMLEHCEVYQYLGPDADYIYNEKWKEVKSF